MSFDSTTKTVVKQVPSTAFNGNPPGITATSSAIWFTLNTLGQLGELTPNATTPNIHDYQFGSPLPAYVPSAGITSVGSGVWITVPAANSVEVLTSGSAFLVPYSLSPANIDVANFQSQVTPGPNQTLWFTGAWRNRDLQPRLAHRHRPGESADVRWYPDADGDHRRAQQHDLVHRISAGVGGSGFSSSAVGVIDANSMTFIKEFPLAAASGPAGITEGQDGNMWFTETGAGAIGFVNTAGLTDPSNYTLGGTIAIPTTGHAGGVLSNPAPVGITAGTDGRLWFADQSGAIGVVTPTHFVVTTLPPSTVLPGGGFGFTVKAEDSSGNVDTGFNGTVTVSLVNNPGGSSSSLGGSNLTVTAVNGVATFSGLTLNVAASGYTLQATSAALDAPTHVVTNGIDVTQSVTPPPPPPPPPAPRPAPPPRPGGGRFSTGCLLDHSEAKTERQADW